MRRTYQSSEVFYYISNTAPEVKIDVAHGRKEFKMRNDWERVQTITETLISDIYNVSWHG